MHLWKNLLNVDFFESEVDLMSGFWSLAQNISLKVETFAIVLNDFSKLKMIWALLIDIGTWEDSQWWKINSSSFKKNCKNQTC